MRGYGWIVLGVWLLAGAVTAEPLRIVTSMKPLALMLGDLPGEDVVVESLVPAGIDPHHYTLKVSDRMRLAQADLVIWVGPELERFLQPLLAQVPAARVLSMESIGAIHWPAVAGGHAHADAHHGAAGASRDPHVWLNPDNALHLQAAVAAWLLQQHQRDRRAALAANRAALAALDTRIRQQLQGLATLKYAAYHDGYGHFVEHFNLPQPLIVAPSATQAPGARHLHALQQELAGASCLLVEPANNNQLARQVAAASGVRIESVDLLGAAAAIVSYAQMLEGVAAAFARCAHGQQEHNSSADE
jgi:zinc transport system substrate-binding protein